MIVAVASGKGGTGKTTLSVNLARISDAPLQLLDCDVEEPNDHLYLDGTLRHLETVCIPVPEIDTDLCDGCGECSRFCAYNAIVGLERAPLVFADLCHGCGGCVRVCPRSAIRERDRPIGVVETMISGHVTLIHGRLNVGAPSGQPLIRRVRAHQRRSGLVLIDAPPGTSCPVVSALRGVDFVMLVAEPTPFGLHDLRLIVDLVRELGIPFGVVVNRIGIGDDSVQTYCRIEGIPILQEIPEDRRVARICSEGSLVVDALAEYRRVFAALLDRLKRSAAGMKV